MIILQTVLLIAAAFALTPALDRLLRRDAGWPLALVYLVGSGMLVVGVGPAVMRGETPTWATPWIPAMNVDLVFRADPLGLFFALLALVIGAVVFVYSTRYLGSGLQLSFYGLMTMFTVSMLGLVLTDDLVVLFGCWELTSLASFLLIARAGKGGYAASLRTLLLTFVGGLSLLAAVALMATRTGTTRLSTVLADPVWHSDAGFTAVVAVLVAIAAFTKSAQFPFHPWLPGAMAAATPVSAYLHAAAVVKAGIFLLLRFSQAFAHVPVWNTLLVSVGLATAVIGALFALQKTDLKKLMAYSTVSQLGWIVATIGIGTRAALIVAVLHTLAHALFKSGLFMLVGVVDHATGTRDIRRLGPLYRRLPWTFGAVLVGAISMAGLPPTLGFISKEGMLGALRTVPGPEWAPFMVLAVGVVGAVLTFAYCARIVLGGFVDGPRDDIELHRTSPIMVFAAALPAVIGLPLAFVPGILDAPLDAIGDAVSGRHGDAAAGHGVHLALWHGFTLELGSTALIVTAGVLLAVERRRVDAALAGELLPRDGAAVISSITAAAARFGERLGRPVRTDSPTRHLALPLGAAIGIAAITTAAFHFSPDLELPAAHGGLDTSLDVALLALIALATVGVVRARSRVSATVLLGGVGIGVTMQIFALGAPDVGLTQLLVEALTVIVIMLVLRRLPARFTEPRPRRRRFAAAMAAGVGIAAFLGTCALTGRRTEKPEVARFYLEEGPRITGGDNVVNTILVEFRALDTFGELTVLGFAGIAILAVLASVPTIKRRIPVENPRSRAEVDDAVANAVPMRLLMRVLIPILGAVSVVLFARGHGAPGGGFIAALVAGCAVSLLYLSRPIDRDVAPRHVPPLLIGAGVTVAALTGAAGYLIGGHTFLEAGHPTVAGVHLSSAMLFDLGVYLAVLGLVMVAINRLGVGDVPSGIGLPSEDDVDDGTGAGAGAGSGATGAAPTPTTTEGGR